MKTPSRSIKLLTKLILTCGLLAPAFAARIDTLAFFNEMPERSREVGSQSSQSRLLRIRPSVASASGEATVPVEMIALGDERSLRFTVRYDPSLLDFNRAALARGIAGAELRVDNRQADLGRIGIEIDLNEGSRLAAGLNRLVHLQFKFAAAPRSTEIAFDGAPEIRALNSDQPLTASQAGGALTIAAGIEGDLAPRPDGSAEGQLTVGDWVQAGRFAVALDEPETGAEFQRADAAPRDSSGDGRIGLADWVQIGRYVAGLDAPQPAAGPTLEVEALAAGSAVALTGGAARIAEPEQARDVRIPNQTFTRGQDNTLAIELVAQGNENAVSFTLSFDPTVMAYVRTALGSGAAGATLTLNTNQTGQGRLGVALALPAGQTFAAGVRQLLIVTFTVPAAGNSNQTTVSFIDQPVGRSVVDANAGSLPSGFLAGTVNFTPTVNALPIISAISPNFVIVGGPAFTLIVNGSDFVNGASVRVNGQDRATRFVNATELQAIIPASDIVETGSLGITVVNPSPGGGTSATLQLAVNNPLPTIATVSPTVVGVGGTNFTLTVTGSNFVPGAHIRWNGEDRQTSFVSSTQLTALITSDDLDTEGPASITVINPLPGGGLSNAATVSVIQPSSLPRITSLSPSTLPTGSLDFTLTVNGSGFAVNSIVRWNGAARPTTFISPTELRAQISAADVAVEGDYVVSVVTPPPGGGNSNSVLFTVRGVPNPVPSITTINPSAVTSGGGDFTITLTGQNFLSNSVVLFNGQTRPTTFLSATELQATIFAADIATGGTAQLRVSNPPPGGGQSQPVTLTIGFGKPSLTQLSPSSALVGGPAFTLTVIGTSFTPSASVRWNGAARPTTFISGTEVTAQIPASDIAVVGNAQVTVQTNEGGISDPRLFAVTASENPLPRLNSISPNIATVGGPAFILVLTGTGFIETSAVRWNGQVRPTFFVSATELRAQISAADIAAVGTAQVTVQNSTPGGGTSNPVAFTIEAAGSRVPTIATITPTQVNAGAPGFIMIVTGSNFSPNSVVQINSEPRPTTFVSANELQAQISAADIAFGGTLTVNVLTPPPGGGTSNVVTLVVANPLPTITGINPTFVGTGSTGPLVITGTNFVPGTQVQVNGVTRSANVISGTQLVIGITDADTQSIGLLSIRAVNPAPGGGASNTVTLEVKQNNPLPRLTEIVPNSAQAGGPGFTLVVNGSGFVPGSIVRWNNSDRPTEFISPTTLAAAISSEDLGGGLIPVRVFNPLPGGGQSGTIFFSVSTPAPQLLGVSPNPLTGSSQPQAITVTGANFVGNSVVLFNGQPRPTTFVNSTQLTATLSPSDQVGITSATIAVQNPAPGGGTTGTITLQIIPGNNPVPTITGLAPAAVQVGSSAFELTVNGTGFVPGAVVNLNGAARPTSYVSATQLKAQLPASDVATIGTANVTVTNPAPGGGTSNVSILTITPQPPGAPTISGISPSGVAAGSPGFALTVTGTNFIATSVVHVNGQPRPTTFNSVTQLVAQIPATDVASSGSLNISVVTPPPGGGTSNVVALTISTQPNPIPSLSSIEPLLVTAGGGGFTLIVNGANFVPGAVVRWNGLDRPTTFISPTRVTAAIPASDIAMPGSASITVFNPAPGGGSSLPLGIVIDRPPDPSACTKICFRSPQFLTRNINRLPDGLIVIGGLNFNSPISIRANLNTVRNTLQGGAAPQQRLNREYVTAQINVLMAGSFASNAALQSSLSCYDLSFQPVQLSNSVIITSSTTLGQILAEARAAFVDNRIVDMDQLALILALLNGDDPFNPCPRP